MHLFFIILPIFQTIKCFTRVIQLFYNSPAGLFLCLGKVNNLKYCRTIVQKYSWRRKFLIFLVYIKVWKLWQIIHKFWKQFKPHIIAYPTITSIMLNYKLQFQFDNILPERYLSRKQSNYPNYCFCSLDLGNFGKQGFLT